MSLQPNFQKNTTLHYYFCVFPPLRSHHVSGYEHHPSRHGTCGLAAEAGDRHTNLYHILWELILSKRARCHETDSKEGIYFSGDQRRSLWRQDKYAQTRSTRNNLSVKEWWGKLSRKLKHCPCEGPEARESLAVFPRLKGQRQENRKAKGERKRKAGARECQVLTGPGRSYIIPNGKSPNILKQKDAVIHFSTQYSLKASS